MARALALGVAAALGLALGPGAAQAAFCLQERPGLEAACIGLEQESGPRAYRLFVPQTLPPGPRPLLLLLHGAGGSGAAMEALTFQRFNRLAEREGFVIASPDGLFSSWNAGLMPSGTDDVAFLRAVIDDVAARTPIDGAQVRVAGFSMGAMMALRLACQAPDRIAAVAAIAGYLPRDVAATCAARPGLRALVIGGDRDAIVPFAGGAPSLGGNSYGSMLGGQATAAHLAQGQACAAPSASRVVDQKPDDGTRLLIADWTCTAPAAVELIHVEGGGHTWPGGLMWGPPNLAGTLSAEMDPVAPVWAFLAGTAAP
ncbi:alpha/beta hydrolase family esterase [Zavarzinia sp. CC-PAN008]|uniref:alpha/beta hydrolase family esterase n=1 Tax=Zavarzinia sp. CC-PAN008 TaxID=3243332 RepID=UPI003F749F9E